MTSYASPSGASRSVRSHAIGRMLVWPEPLRRLDAERELRRRSIRGVDRRAIVGELGEVRRLAADARTRIEHALARLRCRRDRDELRAGVLHRPQAAGERRASRRITEPVDRERIGGRVDRANLRARGREQLHHRRARRAAAVGTRDQRRRLCERGRTRGELVELRRRAVAADCRGKLVDDPARQRILGGDPIEARRRQCGLLAAARSCAALHSRSPRASRRRPHARLRPRRRPPRTAARGRAGAADTPRCAARRPRAAACAKIRVSGERAIDPRAMAEHAVDQLGREPAIAVVEGRTRERTVERRRRPRSITLDAFEHASRELACRHGRADGRAHGRAPCSPRPIDWLANRSPVRRFAALTGAPLSRRARSIGSRTARLYGGSLRSRARPFRAAPDRSAREPLACTEVRCAHGRASFAPRPIDRRFAALTGSRVACRTCRRPRHRALPRTARPSRACVRAPASRGSRQRRRGTRRGAHPCRWRARFPEADRRSRRSFARGRA